MAGMKVVISGENLHGIGYRYFLMEAALNFGIKRFRAVNVLGDAQEVHVFVAGEEEQLREYRKFVSTNFPDDAGVEGITHEEYKGYVPKIESFALVFNVGQMRKFIEVGKSLDAKMETSLNKQDEHIELTKQILSKQDEHIEISKQTLEATREISSKQDEHIALTKEILDETRGISAKQEEGLRVAKSIDAKVGSFARAEEEIKRLREEFQQLKQALREAGIKV